MTTLLYAMGTGLGHLVRARAFAHGHDIPLHVLTTHPRASAVLGDIAHTVVDDAVRCDGPSLRELLELMVDHVRARHVILDVFPAGIRNELVGWRPPEGGVSLLARRLQQPPVSGGPRIRTAWICEPLEAWQLQWLQAHCDALRPARLVDPPVAADPAVVRTLESLLRPIWMVVHTGPLEEVQLLVDHARDEAFARGVTPTLVVVHPHLRALDGVRCLNCIPAWPLFSHVDRVVGAAGFNLVRQCHTTGVDVLPIPLPRRFDDQAGRARGVRRRLSFGPAEPVLRDEGPQSTHPVGSGD